MPQSTQDIPPRVRDRLCPLADIITPNHFEFEWLCGAKATTTGQAIAQARMHLQQGNIVERGAAIGKWTALRRLPILAAYGPNLSGWGSGQRGAPAAQRGRTTLTVPSPRRTITSTDIVNFACLSGVNFPAWALALAAETASPDDIPQPQLGVAVHQQYQGFIFRNPLGSIRHDD